MMRFVQELFSSPDSGSAKELWPASGYHLPIAPAEEEAFDAHCQKRIAKSGRIGAVLALAANLAFWPLDLLIYRGVPEAVRLPVAFRIAVLLSCLFFLALPRRHPWVLRHSFWLLMIGLCGIMAGLGYSGGSLGGLDRPWFFMALPTLCATMMFPMRLQRRVVMMVLQGLAWLAGLFLFWPQNLHSRYLGATLSMLVLVSLYSLIMGHYLTALLRDNFRQSLQISRDAEELEQKVADKTQTLRDLLSQLERAREEERARVSRDLHDELGQELTALRYALGLTSERFRRDPAGIGRNLSELDHLLQRTNRTVRSLVGQLRPLILDDLGLKAAIEWLLQRGAQRTGLIMQAEVSGDDSKLSSDLASAVFRIVQEALTNIIRHANATRVQLDLTIAGGELQLRIRDDGVGFVPATTRLGSGSSGGHGKMGVGLLGMRERALSLGATFDIQSQPGSGTEIRATFPNPQPSEPPMLEVSA